MSAVQQIMAAIGGVTTPAAITYQSANSNETNLTSYSFLAQAIGTAAADRFVKVNVAALANSNFGTISGVTIGGVAATLLSDGTRQASVADASGFCKFACYGLLVAAGTTADIVVTTSAAPDRLGITVESITGLVSSTPTEVQTQNTASANLVKSINTTSSGILSAFAGIENSAATWTWTNVTERQDSAVGTGGSSQSTANDNIAAGSSLSITAAPSAAGTHQGLILVAMR